MDVMDDDRREMVVQCMSIHSATVQQSLARARGRRSSVS